MTWRYFLLGRQPVILCINVAHQRSSDAFVVSWMLQRLAPCSRPALNDNCTSHWTRINLHSDMATASLSLVSLICFRSVTCQPEVATTPSTIAHPERSKIAYLHESTRIFFQFFCTCLQTFRVRFNCASFCLMRLLYGVITERQHNSSLYDAMQMSCFRYGKSDCLSVCHPAVLCQNKSSYRNHEIFTDSFLLVSGF